MERRSRTATCKQCQKEFLLSGHGSYIKLFCSLECRRYHTRQNVSESTSPGNRSWLPEEDNLLRELATRLHAYQITKEWEGIAKEKGWLLRSQNAIWVRLKRLGLSINGDTDNFSMHDFARKLGIKVDRITKWVDSEWLPTDNYGWDGERYHIKLISKANFKRFACKYVDELWGIEERVLSRVLGDKKLAKEIFTLCRQPTTGRAITVVRLNTDEVYASSKQAGEVNKISKTTVLRNLFSDTPIKKVGHFVRLDYPLFLVPLEFRESFNKVAGKILLSIFEELEKIENFKKTICITISIRMAVKVAIMLHRKRLYNTKEYLELNEISYTDFWQNRFIEIYKKHTSITPQISIRKIKINIKNKIGWFFNNIYKSLGDEKLEDFCNWFITKAMERYFLDSCLPENYNPKNNFETADLYSYIEGVSNIRFIRNRKVFEIVKTYAYTYVYHNPPQSQFNPDWAKHGEVHMESTEEFSAIEKLKDLLENLEKSNVDSKLKCLCKQYVEVFCQSGDAYQTKIDMDITRNQEAEILEVLNRMALPF
jgi:hypothetical protein